MDTFTKEERSRIMASVKSGNAKSTEQTFIKFVKKHKIIGWRRNYSISGKPDFVFIKARIAIFLDGCFWHGCRKHFRLPSSNVNYWRNKIENNVKRDKKINKELSIKKWLVVRIWEHDTKKESTYYKLKRKINMRIEEK